MYLRSFLEGKSRNLYIYIVLSVLALALTGCLGGGGGGSSGPAPCVGTTATTRNVDITWPHNNEVDVRQAGGGYRVYTSTTQGFSIGGVTPVDVPYNAAAMTNTLQLNLASGRHYIKIVAYSGTRTSQPSAEISVCVPFNP